MTSLTNPIGAQNIVDRFADYVVATANSGISWGTNAYPFGEFDGNYFGGDTNGRGIGINGNSLGGTGAVVNGTTIYNTLVNETYAYTRLRNLRAQLNVTGGGGNTGSRGSPGIVYDNTAKANMNTNYLAGISPANGGVASTALITSAGLEQYFNNLRSSYAAVRDSTVLVTINVCHASCHSSCHSSRGRR
jgi:hypothetical protein